DSGKVMSSQSVKVRYGGAPISSRERIYWKVRVWDENGVESDWSDVNFFEAGLLSQDDWQAKWILTTEKPHNLYFYKSPYNWGKVFPDGKRPRMGVAPIHVRKSFESDKPISARLYVSSLGIFHAFINEKRIDNDYWKTGWTDYNKRVQSNTYDVTKYLTSGKNVLAFTLADGWYASRIQSYKVCRAPKIIAQLELTYADGSKKFLRQMKVGSFQNVQSHMPTFTTVKFTMPQKKFMVGIKSISTILHGQMYSLKMSAKPQ
ncbi:MAG: alpha-L-rhamnosidase N-terminal domain-containing protein, partial [Opitutales bacterium]|nr:alpha-L-rhamnosidase N-terminal domain-containing protein [Opitutales bacterium]